MQGTERFPCSKAAFFKTSKECSRIIRQIRVDRDGDFLQKTFDNEYKILYVRVSPFPPYCGDVKPPIPRFLFAGEFFYTTD